MDERAPQGPYAACCWWNDDMDFRPIEQIEAEWEALPRSEKCLDCPACKIEES